MIQLVHWYCIDHRHLVMVVLEHEYHVKVLEVELYAFKVDKFNFIQRYHQRRLHTHTHTHHSSLALSFTHTTNSVKALKTVNYKANNSVLTSAKQEVLFDLHCCLQCFDTVGWVAGRASGL